MTIKSYSEMRHYDTFEERYEYLSLKSVVGDVTFGFERWMNQQFYKSREWRHLRQQIIARDEGMDLGVPGFEIFDKIIIHHINPMTLEDFEAGNPMMLDPNNLITTTMNTHNAIHFGDKSLLRVPIEPRRPGDTILW
ncbi:MAG: hypothetical protein BWY50_01999 [Spirochaetes bacterium ADurb.Bin315]|nr:MAG: hypothetical protein BWY50_01999 [Spirochaetes bacterium ADurb.Bin315]